LSISSINRDARYLRESFIAFLHKHDINPNLIFSSDDLDIGITQKKQFFKTPQIKTPQKKVYKKNCQSPVIKRYDIFLSWPLNRKKFWISSYYGLRKSKGRNKFHFGLDLAALKGTNICAAAPGEVIESGFVRGYGNTVVIKHGLQYKTRYAHLDRIKVSVGKHVERGESIGTVGDTGHVRSKIGKDASHLHFEVLAFGKHINPLSVLP
jgi:murein DD-endopeptidase MepM/ murein hydrolase activator NlpD